MLNFFRPSPGIRCKLILIFIIIKVLPLVLLAWLAQSEISRLGLDLGNRAEALFHDGETMVSRISSLASEESIVSLDRKAQENIERLTVETAARVADFLFQRDEDILLLASLDLSAENLANFLSRRQRPVCYHKEYRMDERGEAWIPDSDVPVVAQAVFPVNPDNRRNFNYKPPVDYGLVHSRPLYLEATYIDLKGRELVKRVTSDLLFERLKDVSDPANTWCRAETYFAALSSLKPGEIYVSEVIGAYVGSPLIGVYSQKRCQQQGIEFAPEKAAYAGLENPLGRRFQGLLRWATPVCRQGEVVGYVTLALDHTHIMEFTDHLIPTERGFSPISDASTGNYAFMWDHQGRNISHPRDFFICGFDPATGKRVVPWLEQNLYDQWQASGLDYSEFQPRMPVFQESSLRKKGSRELLTQGFLGLDGRYLNFAPQCAGWHNLTQNGGSGSFMIYWSGLWKLTTAAAIPYYTGIYGQSRRGFGYVTIGANVDEFHRAANNTATLIGGLQREHSRSLNRKNLESRKAIQVHLGRTLRSLTICTAAMIVIVILIAVWLSAFLTARLTRVVSGLENLHQGKLDTRLPVEGRDELALMAQAFNKTAEKLEQGISELQLAREKAEESDRVKSSFLANMSHEIRTPINGIMGLADILLKSPLDVTQTKHLQTLKLSAGSLLTVINDILDFSKIEAGKMDLVLIDFRLEDLLAGVMRMFMMTAQEKGLALSCEVAPEVPLFLHGDSSRLQQVLVNLLANALKFTAKGWVRLRVSMAAAAEVITGDGSHDSFLRFTVADSGIGIPRDRFEQIFEAFRQGDPSHTRRYGGSGLGLAISANLVQLMGGRIGLSEQIEVGAEFYFTIPCCPATGRTGLEPGQPGRRQLFTGLRILLAEDEVVNVMVARAMLEDLGIEVMVASSGYEVLALIEDADFDLILMDVQMPGLDGLATTIEIRRREELTGGHRVIVAVTAHAMKGYQEKCLAAGMDAYLSKPFNEGQLVALLDDLLPVPENGGVASFDPECLENLARPGRSGNRNLLAKTLKIYLDSLPGRHAAIDRALAEGDYREAGLQAHALKSSSAQLGALSLAEICAEIEAFGREGGGGRPPEVLSAGLQAAVALAEKVFHERLSQEEKTIDC
ncbi:MAG: response regulator [Deltaproteobacteria bacterium]|nr:response regulator [Deltaproteobacteria bacterium]